jgi:ClpP class serine protease
MLTTLLLSDALDAVAYRNISSYLEGKYPESWRVLATKGKSRFSELNASKNESSNNSGSNDSIDSKIIAISIKGFLTKNDIIDPYSNEVYSWGTDSLQSFLKTIEHDDTVKGILFRINSPGGESESVNDLPGFLANYSKPTLAYIDSLCGSAAYKLAAACDKIVARNALNRLGSVGTMAVFSSNKKMMEGMGIEFREIYASESIQKNLPFREAEKGNDEPIVADFLDPINESFLAFVKQQRPNVSQDALEGKLFFAKDAKEAGLIDEYNIEIEDSLQFFNIQKSGDQVMNKIEQQIHDLAISIANKVKGKDTSQVVPEVLEATNAEETVTTNELADEPQNLELQNELREVKENLDKTTANLDLVQIEKDRLTTALEGKELEVKHISEVLNGVKERLALLEDRPGMQSVLTVPNVEPMNGELNKGGAFVDMWMDEARKRGIA